VLSMLRPTAVSMLRPQLARAMSTKIVATATGPAGEKALSSFTRTVLGQGGTLGGSRSMEVSGTVSISSVVYLPDAGSEGATAVAELTWALQTSLQGFLVSIRPADHTNPPTIFARVTVAGADRMGILSELADHLDTRDIQLATMRTQTDASRYGPDGIEGTDDDEEPLYSAVATLASFKPELDVEWIENELYEFAEKADLTVDFQRLTAEK